MLPEAARFFLETTSIRGVGKIVKTQNVFLSRLWLLFVLASTSLLFYSVFKVTADYLQYDVNIQTYHKIDDATPFPAVSICNNQPFSQDAYKLWAAKQVKSPSEFNRELRQKALDSLTSSRDRGDFSKVLAASAEGRTQDVKKLRHHFEDQAFSAMHLSLVLDSSRIYYQNTASNDSIRLGHERNASLVECVFKYGRHQALATKGCHDPILSVTQFSDPNFFNCMTIEFDRHIRNDVLSLTLIVWLGPNENYDMRYRQAFLYDVFEQAFGLRVAIHEPRSQPRILERGMQIEPGKMNELKYQPVRFERSNTPKNPCISPEETSHVRLKDLYNEYSYDLELCLNSKVQEVVLRHCGCMYIELPRIAVPNGTHPYCGVIDDKMTARTNCMKRLKLRDLRKSFEESDCLPKCAELTYDKELSVTKWRDTQWMLYWIKELCERWDNYFSQFREGPVGLMQDYEDSLDQLKEYLANSNITNVKPPKGKESLKFDNHHTFLVVKRQSNNTLVKKEKIVLTLNALFSRVGGLCSVYIGLTLAFFMECIELLFKLVCERSGRDRAEPGGGVGGAKPAAEVSDNGEQLGLIRSTPGEPSPPPPQDPSGPQASAGDRDDRQRQQLPRNSRALDWISRADSSV